MAAKLWVVPALVAAVGGGLPYAAELVLYLATSIALGIAMAVLIESPFLALRDRLYPSRAAPPHQTGPLPASRTAARASSTS